MSDTDPLGLPHPSSLLPICKQRVSVPHRHLTLYRPLPTSSSSSSSFLFRLLDSLYSWSKGLGQARQALEKVKRDRDRAKHQWAAERVERETLDDDRIRYRSFLSRALFWLAGLGGPVFSPPLSSIDIKVEWQTLFAEGGEGFDLVVRGYESWQDERLRSMLTVLGTSVSLGSATELDPNSVCLATRTPHAGPECRPSDQGNTFTRTTSSI